MIEQIVGRAEIVVEADRFDLLRCRCSTCLVLDALYPHDGFQLALPKLRGKMNKRRSRNAG